MDDMTLVTFSWLLHVQQALLHIIEKSHEAIALESTQRGNLNTVVQVSVLCTGDAYYVLYTALLIS